MANILEMDNHRAKWSEWVVLEHIWGIFYLLAFKTILVSFDAPAIFVWKWFFLKYGFNSVVLRTRLWGSIDLVVFKVILRWHSAIVSNLISNKHLCTIVKCYSTISKPPRCLDLLSIFVRVTQVGVVQYWIIHSCQWLGFEIPYLRPRPLCSRLLEQKETFWLDIMSNLRDQYF